MTPPYGNDLSATCQYRPSPEHHRYFYVGLNPVVPIFLVPIFVNTHFSKVGINENKKWVLKKRKNGYYRKYFGYLGTGYPGTQIPRYPDTQIPRYPDTQYPVPSTQYPVPSTQYPVPSTQYPVPSTQYPVPSTQVPKIFSIIPIFSFL